MLIRTRLLALPALLVWFTTLAHAQPGPGDWGDAPEGNTAYPSLGIAGQFPTCFGGPSGYVRHANLFPILFWGAGMDTELDGNAGICAPPPYEQDECYYPIDGEGGLTYPDGWTFDPGLLEIPCGPYPPRPLGNACTLAYWGGSGNLELVLTNLTGNPAWVNVVFDWNQDGVWGGASIGCSGGRAPEWVVRNLPVPQNFAGLLSALSPGPFEIGPRSGWVWARFTVSDGPPLATADWNGAGDFDSGETEDYLLYVSPALGNAGELGDAPEDRLAYPPNGVMGRFPTCIGGPAGFVWHEPVGTLFLGSQIDYEGDGNHTNCSFIPYDDDECDAGGSDAGLVAPGSFTINGTGNYVTCPTSPAGTTLGHSCGVVAWGPAFNVRATNNAGRTAYLHVLADWDHDGAWDTDFISCPPATTRREQVLLNFPIPAGFTGDVSALSPPSFIAPTEGYVWFRFTTTTSQVHPDWNGSGWFPDGETEDYLLRVDPPAADVDFGPLPNSPFAIERVDPNPSGDASAVWFAMREAGVVKVSIVDLAGRTIATLLDGSRPAGRHQVSWNGRRDDGGLAGPGVYFVRGHAAGLVRSFKLTRLK